MAITERLNELEAINSMLANIGSSPITNAEDPQNADAIMAKSSLRLVLREIQAEKWWFNSESNYPLKRNEQNEILIPENITHIDFTGKFGEYSDLVIRGTKLYNKETHSFKFDNDVTANIRWALSFDEIPEAAKIYVIIKASRKFQDQVQGDNNSHVWTQADEIAARGRLIAEDIRQTKPHFGIIPRIDPNVSIDMRNL